MTSASVDIKKVWFDSIKSGDIKTLTRLIYSTPNPVAGVDRLKWTCGDNLPVFVKSRDLLAKLDIDGRECWSLPFAILCWLESGKSKACVDACKIICSACPITLIMEPIGNGNTVLHLASLTGNMEIFRMILDKKPDPQHMNLNKQMPSDIASPLLKNMLEDYSNKHRRSQMGSLSAITLNKMVAEEEEVLKKLGVDVNDTEAQAMKMSVLKRRESQVAAAKRPSVFEKVAAMNEERPRMIKTANVLPPVQDVIIVEKLVEKPSIVLSAKTVESEVRPNDDIVVSIGASSTVSQRPPAFSEPRRISIPLVKPTPAPPPTVAIDERQIEQVKSFKDEPAYFPEIRQELILLDQNDKSGTTGKNVLFKNSWRGELEKTRKFFPDAATSSLSQNVGRPALSDKTFTQPTSVDKTSYSKIFLKLKSLRGVIVNCNRPADVSYFYCAIHGAGLTPFFTRKIRFNPENMYQSISIDQEFAMPTNGKFELTIELRVSLEFYPPNKRFSTQLLRRGSIKEFFTGQRPRQNSLADEIQIHEESICAITFTSDDFANQQTAPVEVNEPWTVSSSVFPQNSQTNLQRPASRASIQYFKSKLFHDDTKSTPIKCTVSPLEAGSLSLELFSLVNLRDEIEQKMVPNTIAEAMEWVDRKKWHETTWFSGHLSQQGGDVQIWRRRFYKIVGSKMMAHHEFTNEFRAAIDLTQVTALEVLPMEIDGESFPILNSFRLNFKHGESIDFYAETKAEADNWISQIREILSSMPESPDSHHSSAINLNTHKSAKSKQRGGKKMSFDTSASVDEDSFRTYDKRLKTPAVRKGLSLMNFNSTDSTSSFDADQSVQTRSNPSFVGLFGTGNVANIPEL